MNFVKDHLISLLCAVAVLAVLGWYYFWVGARADRLQQAMLERLNQVHAVEQLARQPISIPGATPFQGVVTKDIIEVKRKVQEDMHETADKIALLASQLNERGRVVRHDLGGKAEAKVVPLLDGIEQPNFLPKITPDAEGRPTDPNDFFEAYNATFNRWISLLVTGSAKPPAGFEPSTSGAPPSRELATAYWESYLARSREGSGVPSLQQVRPMVDVIHDFVSDRATKIRMYATRDCFTRRGSTKNEQEIFEALVDCWLQADVVHAIDAVNSEALRNVPAPADRNVGQAPIKRLERITVGVGSGPGSSSLFAVSDRKGAGLDYTRDLTGHTGTTKYDVTAMEVVLALDPSYLNRFIATLYRQNNSYTILNVKIATVDPFAAASNGYLYGNQQVVMATLQIEAILFHGWTDPLKPVYPNGALPAAAAAAH